MTELQLDEKWIQIQHKTFTRWANTFLRERMLKIESLETGLSDGTMLIALLEIISSKTVAPRYAKTPKILSQKLENINYCLDFLRKENIRLVNIGAEDIVDSKLKLILGLIWTVILRYQIQVEQGKSARSDLLNWVRSKIPEYNINNFTTDWNDGRAVCGLTNALQPGSFPDHFSLDPANALANATAGENLAEKELGIPKVLAPEDMISSDVDELSVMTYISYFRDYEANEAKRKGDAVVEATPVAGKCKAYGPGLERAEATVSTEFTIEAINAHGRRVPQGGAPFNVSITAGGNGDEVPREFTDNGDGTYHVRYTPAATGTYVVNIKLDQAPLNGNPWRVPVTRTAPDGSKSRAYGPGLEGGAAYSPADFTVETYNRFGTRVADGGDKVEVKVAGPYDMAAQATVHDNKDGTYSVRYEPHDAGEYEVAVTVNGAALPASPYKVTIAKNQDSVDAATTVAYGPGLELATTAEKAVFTVETRTPSGSRYTKAGALVDVWVEDAAGKEVAVSKSDNGDGSFAVSYDAKEVGEVRVNVVVRSKASPAFYDHIQGSTFFVPVEAGTDASQSIAYGPGLESSVYDTLPSYFTIQAKDRNGKNIPKGGEEFEVTITDSRGNTVPATTQDNGDGTYRVDYEPSAAGKHKVDVKHKGKHIKDAPFTVVVKAGADGTHSVIESYQFTIRAKNKQGEDKTEGGDSFGVEVAGPDGKVTTASVNDLKNGSYVAVYSLAGKGEHKVHVKLNGRDIAGSPLVQHAN